MIDDSSAPSPPPSVLSANPCSARSTASAPAAVLQESGSTLACPRTPFPSRRAAATCSSIMSDDEVTVEPSLSPSAEALSRTNRSDLFSNTRRGALLRSLRTSSSCEANVSPSSCPVRRRVDTSSTATNTSASLAACVARLMPSCSISPASSLKPAVSERMTLRPFSSSGTSTMSRVVPGWLVTIAAGRPASRFRMLLCAHSSAMERLDTTLQRQLRGTARAPKPSGDCGVTRE
mmetsp:Transcript_5440/g.13759  ORF Transcript_5440/g.13759 Transcript_5440/m.13759 type:complete len:234 (-) Transcript_5440:242-943(-)